MSSRNPDSFQFLVEPLVLAQKNVHVHSRVHYTGHYKVKYMVQACQFKKAHEDSHYAVAIFRYQRELAAMFRECSTFFCMDDKDCELLDIIETKYLLTNV